MSSKVLIITSDEFRKNVKRLAKKYRSLPDDLRQLLESLKENPYLGDRFSDTFYKIRIAVKSKGKGKSGGARVITNVDVEVIDQKETIEVILLRIYDKSSMSTITKADLEGSLKKHLRKKAEEE